VRVILKIYLNYQRIAVFGFTICPIILLFQAINYKLLALIMKKILILIFIISFFLIGCSSVRKNVRQEGEHHKVSFKARDLFLQGLFYQSEGRYNEALVQFYQALHHDSTSPTIYNSIAENHIKLGHFDSAKILLKKALSMDPNNLESYSLLADTYFRMRDDEAAIDAYKKVLELDPYNEDARKYLIFLYEKRRDEIGLAKQYEELNELYGTDVANLEKIAQIYQSHKEFDKLIETYQKMLDIDSTDAEIYLKIGKAEEWQHKPEEAEKWYLKAMEIEPNYFPAAQELAYLYRNNEEWQKIIDLYKTFESDTSNTVPEIMSAEAYYYLKEYGMATEILQPILSQKKTPPLMALNLSARIDFDQKDYTRAKSKFKKLIGQDPQFKYAWLFLGFTYSETDQPDSAAIIYTKALDLFPKDPTFLAFLGYSLQEQKRFNEALNPLKLSIQYDPKNINAISSLAVVYESLKLYVKSDSVYTEAVKQFPDNPLLLNNFSYSLSERDVRLEEALQMSQKAVAAEPDNAAYLDTIGWIYYKLGNYIEAEKYIKQAIELRESSAVVFEHLGDVYHKLGNSEQARQYWSKALNLDSENAELKQKLEMINADK
jgi:tetratricopeptide (TPR) repeat protein